MALQIIGAGLGRTGTESLKKALELLGYGSCYHMFELVRKPERLRYWEQLGRGEIPDYDALFEGYQATSDFPAAIYYREFMQQYPDAKVVLTVRDADSWFESASRTILRGIPPFILAVLKFFARLSKKGKAQIKVNGYAVELVHRQFFGGRTRDREYCKKVFLEWNEEVKRNVPADKLLVFEVKQGWQPLCEFLGVPVPAEPFPRANAGEGFNLKMIDRIRKGFND
jgi:hypothetical protein